MQVRNVLHAARWKSTTQKLPKIRHLGTIAQLCRAISSQLRHMSTIEKSVKQQFLPHMFSEYGELRPTSGRDRFASLGHPSYFPRVSCLGSVTARHCSRGASVKLYRGRHLYSTGRPSRWALAHILVSVNFRAAQSLTTTTCLYNSATAAAVVQSRRHEPCYGRPM